MNFIFTCACTYIMHCDHIYTTIAFSCTPLPTPVIPIPLLHFPQSPPPLPFSSLTPPTEFNSVIGLEELLI